MKDKAIREEYIIIRSFHRGYSTHSKNKNTPDLVIKTQNIWRKFGREKGKRLKLGMLETYADIQTLVPPLVR